MAKENLRSDLMDEQEELALQFQAQPNAADARVVAEGHQEVLAAQVGSRRREPFALILRRKGGTVAGGLLGKVLFDDLHIDQVWLHESIRGRGYGRRLMEEAEAHAAGEGCRRAFLNTMSTEALSFFEHVGYYEIGRIANFPVGRTVFFLRKDLETLMPESG